MTEPDGNQLVVATQSMSQAEIDLRREELQLKHRQFELSIDLAKFGLTGTLWGGCLGIFLIAYLAWLPSHTDTELIAIGLIIGTTVILYGGFVCKQSVKIAFDKTRGLVLKGGNGEQEQ